MSGHGTCPCWLLPFVCRALAGIQNQKTRDLLSPKKSHRAFSLSSGNAFAASFTITVRIKVFLLFSFCYGIATIYNLKITNHIHRWKLASFFIVLLFLQKKSINNDLTRGAWFAFSTAGPGRQDLWWVTVPQWLSNRGCCNT